MVVIGEEDIKEHFVLDIEFLCSLVWDKDGSGYVEPDDVDLGLGQVEELVVDKIGCVEVVGVELGQ